MSDVTGENERDKGLGLGVWLSSRRRSPLGWPGLYKWEPADAVSILLHHSHQRYYCSCDAITGSRAEKSGAVSWAMAFRPLHVNAQDTDHWERTCPDVHSRDFLFHSAPFCSWLHFFQWIPLSFTGGNNLFQLANCLSDESESPLKLMDWLLEVILETVLQLN